MQVNKVTVSGDLGNFKQGEVLTDRSQIAAYYRLSVNEGAGKDTNLSDAQILSIIDRVNVSECGEEDYDDIDVLRTDALENRATAA